MGIEIPEEYGGQGGTFFQSVLAVEELAAVDPSAAVIVDVQNTLVINALLRWGDDEQKRKYLPRLAKDTVGAYALSEAGSGSDAFRPADTRRAGGRRRVSCSPAASSGSPMPPRPASFWCSQMPNPEAGYKGITCFLVERGARAFRSGTRKTSSASAHPPPAS